MNKAEHDAHMGRRLGNSRMVGPYKRTDLLDLLRQGKMLPSGISYSPSSREPFLYIDEDGAAAADEGGDEDDT
jgi:hypothetical protein